MILDIVPNRTSDQHPWFQEALTSAPASPDRERFILREGRRADGSEPPIDWLAAFGGPAWTRTPDGQWYLHVRTWRAIADSYPDPRVFVAEAHVRPGHLADHLRPGELHTAFNFDFLKCALEADRLKEVIRSPDHRSGEGRCPRHLCPLQPRREPPRHPLRPRPHRRHASDA